MKYVWTLSEKFAIFFFLPIHDIFNLLRKNRMNRHAEDWDASVSVSSDTEEKTNTKANGSF